MAAKRGGEAISVTATRRRHWWIHAENDAASGGYLTTVKDERESESAGETEAGSAGVQPARDSRLGLRRMVARGGHRDPPPHPFTPFGAFPHASENARQDRGAT